METIISEYVPESYLKVDSLLQSAQELRAAAESFLQLKGQIYMIGEWVTIKRYCKLFNIEDTQIVSNWIRRGIIPTENVQVLEDFNGIKLIKAIPYRIQKVAND
jgi:hypothetical protein